MHAVAANAPAQIVEFGSQDEIIKAIKEGRVDAYPNTAQGHRALLCLLEGPGPRTRRAFRAAG